MIFWGGNHKVDSNIVSQIVKGLKKIKHSFKGGFYSSYHVDPEQRPDKVLNDGYINILEKATKDLGLYYRTDYFCDYWTQVYPASPAPLGTHFTHDHFSGVELFSWVHFIRPTSKKCFRFLDSHGASIYPEQNEGDFIIFPSWALHRVDANEENEDRVVVAGNAIARSIQCPLQNEETKISTCHDFNSRFRLWESNTFPRSFAHDIPKEWL